ncbi:unnamed protein product, partial [Didymodactylos carnosus]
MICYEASYLGPKQEPMLVVLDCRALQWPILYRTTCVGLALHDYHLKSLESFSYSDEQDQGINIRHKVKDIIELVQDDDHLRDERNHSRIVM